jgi:signal transduction histidine kinase
MVGDDLASAKILIVDDEPANVRLLERTLMNAGYREVSSTTDSRRVLPLYREVLPDLLLLDLMMPHLDGVGVLQQLTTEVGNAFVPVLVLTADATPEPKRRALAAGAHDFLTKPFDQFEVLLRIRNLLNTRRLYLALEAEKHALEDTVRDRTERLLQSEKVAAMGSLLAGVAHELNNPLCALSGQAQLLMRSGKDPGDRRRAIKIGEAADRCARIVKNFLALARQRPPERSATDLTDVVRGAVELLGYELKTEGIEVVIEMAGVPPALLADPHQLHQVIVNLLANAQQAMRRQRGPRRITVTGWRESVTGHLRLEIRDTGPGIPPEIREKIFQPFFTTKPPGEGTGLGLALCWNIVDEHQGTLRVESEVGIGTTFVIDLPVVVPSAAPEASDPSAPLEPLAPRHVLVVDDEPALAEIIAEVVERDGHKADIAGNGATALEMLAAIEYDAIVCDTKMPVMDGEALYLELRRRFPALSGRIMFVTGDVLSAEKRVFLERTGVPFLTKPYKLDDVRRTLHGILAGPPASELAGC